MKLILMFICMCIHIFPIRLNTSNGFITAFFDLDKGVIRDIGLGFNPNWIDIDKIELGFVIDNKIYRMKDYNPTITPSLDSNIIEMKSKIEGRYIFSAKLYSSSVYRDRVIVEAKVETIDLSLMYNLQIFYYIHPRLQREPVVKYADYYLYRDNYIKFVQNEFQLYFTNDALLSQLRLIPFINTDIKKEGEALFFLSNRESNIREKSDILILSKNNINMELNEDAYKSEVEYWQKYLENITEEDARNAITTLISYQLRDGSIYNFYERNGKIHVLDTIWSLRALMEYGFESEVKRGLRYFINSHVRMKEKNKPYLISNYVYSFERQEILKKDNYGDMINLINPSLFLSLFSDYYFVTGDEDFIEENIDIVHEMVAEYLLNFVDNQGVMPNSGWNRKGLEGIERFVESQKYVYDALGNYIRLAENFDIDIELFEEARRKIRENFYVYLLDGKILDYPNSEINYENNIYALHREFFRTPEEYRSYLERNMNLIDRYKDRNFLEQVDYILFLYEAGYIDKAHSLRRSLIGRLQRSQTQRLYEMQSSPQFTAKYLILLKKGK